MSGQKENMGEEKPTMYRNPLALNTESELQDMATAPDLEDMFPKFTKPDHSHATPDIIKKMMRDFEQNPSDDLMESILAKRRSLLTEAQTNNNFSDLQLAAAIGNAAFVKRVFERSNRSVDVGALSSDEWTPLSSAVLHGHVDVIKFLIENGAQVNRSLLPIALYSMNPTPEIIDLLLKAGSDPNHKDDNGNTHLHYAAVAIGGKETMKQLLDAGADPNIQNKSGITPLIYAAGGEGTKELITQLLDAGANMHLSMIKTSLLQQRGLDPIGNAKGAISRGGSTIKNTEILSYLENTRDLQNAISSKDFAGAKKYIEKGANLNAVNKEGRTPIQEAVYHGDDKIFNILLTNGAKYDLKSIMEVQKETQAVNNPLIIAAIARHEVAKKALIQASASKDSIVDSSIPKSVAESAKKVGESIKEIHSKLDGIIEEKILKPLFESKKLGIKDAVMQEKIRSHLLSSLKSFGDAALNNNAEDLVTHLTTALSTGRSVSSIVGRAYTISKDKLLTLASNLTTLPYHPHQTQERAGRTM